MPSFLILFLLLHVATIHLPTSILSAPGAVNFDVVCVADVVALVLAFVTGSIAGGFEVLDVGGVFTLVGFVSLGVVVGVDIGDMAVLTGVAFCCIAFMVRFGAVADRCLCAEQYSKKPPPRYRAVALLVHPVALHFGASTVSAVSVLS